ncbi:hypothetical protein Hdeb2414_s0007g00237141 [Helianthus debilis subsp. tardiflorus]
MAPIVRPLSRTLLSNSFISSFNMLSCDETDKSSTQYRGIAHALTSVLCEEGPARYTRDGFLLLLAL